MKKIYNGSWESTLQFKARTDSLEVNEKRKKWGGDKDSCEKCKIRKERNTDTLDHVGLLIECPEYKSGRLNFETEVKRTIGDREWETIKQGEDEGMKEILGLGDCGRKMTDITKKYLATIWRKRKLNKKGQKIIGLKTKTLKIRKRENMGTIVTIKFKGQLIIHFSFFPFYYLLVSAFILKMFLVF